MNNCNEKDDSYNYTNPHSNCYNKINFSVILQSFRNEPSFSMENMVTGFQLRV